MADKLSHRIWLIFQISFFDSRAFFMRSASFSFCSSVSVRLLYGFFPNLNSKSGHWGAEQDLTALLSHPQHSIQNSFIAINGDVGLSFPFLSLISDFKFQISFSKSNFDFQFLNWIYHIKIDLSIPKFKFQNKKWKSNFWIVYKKIDFEFVIRIYVYRYNTNTYTLTINIYKYNYTNPSIRLPDYINLTSSIQLQLDDYRIKTTTNHNQRHIHTHIHIQLHIHNHIFTMSLCNPITLLQSSFGIDQSTKTTLSKRWPHIQNVIQTNTEIPSQSTERNRQMPRNSHIYLGAKFFSHIMRVYRGRFQTGDNACVYLRQNFHSA